jgi:hypothetical protein
MGTFLRVYSELRHLRKSQGEVNSQSWTKFSNHVDEIIEENEGLRRNYPSEGV